MWALGRRYSVDKLAVNFSQRFMERVTNVLWFTLAKDKDDVKMSSVNLRGWLKTKNDTKPDRFLGKRMERGVSY